MCVRAALILFLSAGCALAAAAPAHQDTVSDVAQSPAVDARPRTPFFSGLVTDLKPVSVSVSRKGAQGRKSVERMFLIDAQTKIDGKLKVNARVTVHYETSGTDQRAVRIIVRPTGPSR